MRLELQGRKSIRHKKAGRGKAKKYKGPTVEAGLFMSEARLILNKIRIKNRLCHSARPLPGALTRNLPSMSHAFALANHDELKSVLYSVCLMR